MTFTLLNITTWLEAHQLPCIFKQLTHVDCPGCGFQRSIVLLLKGNFAESFKMYPPLIPILLLLCMLLMYVVKKWKNGHLMLKYGYLICTATIVVSYIVKLISLHR